MPGGRPKGVPNKLSAQVKENIVHVFEQMGGVKKMTAWAEENQTEFFRLYARLAPTDVLVNITRSAEELDDAELASIATGSSDRVAEAESGAKKPSELH